VAAPPPPADGGAPSFELGFSSDGALAQLWVAREILAALGGEARAIGPEGGKAAGGARTYEVELAVSRHPSDGNKE